MFSLKSIARYFTSGFTFSIDGGFGEAALMGALIGGGTSLLTGSNPLTGALLGGLSGGAMEGIGGLMGTAEGATKDALIASTAENSGLPALVQAGDPALADLGSFAKSSYGVDLAQGTAGVTPSGIANGLGSGNPLTTSTIDYNPNAKSMFENIGQAGGYTPDASYAGTTMQNAGVASSPAANLTQTVDGNFIDTSAFKPAGDAVATGTKTAADVATKTAADTAAKPGMFGQAKEWWGGLKPWEKAGVGIAGGVGLHELFKPPTLLDPNIGKQKIDHPLMNLDPNFKADIATPIVYHPSYAGYAGAGYAQGGIAGLDGQSPMSLGMGGNQGFPGGRLDSTQYATPTQMPTSTPVVNSGYEQRTNPYTGEPVGQGFAFGGDVDSDDMTAAAPSVENTAAKVLGASPINNAGIAGFAMGGGIGSLGGYATGGNPRLLKGPGDGMSDSIPATIGQKQPARLADGEFVVPADVVSHLGNGSTDAGAKHLYAMMDKVRAARTGNKQQGKQINPKKFLPA